jgi:hypothetical protein|tara:strand:- start:228 stop:416 length:189 start_codon:yes stop_codon:yes gene_type:complete
MLRIICLVFISLMISCTEPTKVNCEYVMGDEVTTLTTNENTKLFKPGTELKFGKLQEVCVNN